MIDTIVDKMSSIVISGIDKNIALFILVASNFQLLISIKEISFSSFGFKDISNTFKQLVGLFSYNPKESIIKKK